MTNRALRPPQLDELAATVNLVLKPANKTEISALLFSVREGVMQDADPLPDDCTPLLRFDPRWPKA